MEEKYVITLYEKIPISENIIVFKKNKIVENATIDFYDEFSEATFSGENKEEIKTKYLLNPYVVLADDVFCYSYPMSMEGLKQRYPEISDEEELIKKYDSEISKVFEISYYDNNTDDMKILTTNEDIMKKITNDDLFEGFSIEYDSEEENSISIKRSDLKKISKMLKNKQYDKLEKQINDFDEIVEEDYVVARSIFEKIDKRIEKENEEVIDKALKESINDLNKLVGLSNVKKEVNGLVKYLLYKNKTQKYLNLDHLNLNMFFTGNPGTGKTTVARIVSKVLYDLGFVNSSKFSEVTARSLIAEYVGHTAVKTAKFISQNKGGVIFIDEAYVLAAKHQGFAEEALVEIMKELEKKSTIFIFAGYTDEMQKLLDLNPGLKSRIGFYLNYEDYSALELYQIFENKAFNIGFKIDPKLKEKLILNFAEAKNNEDFGNGRYVDTVLDKIIITHSINTERYKRRKELITLTEKDFNPFTEETLSGKQKTKNRIGF